MAPSDPAPAALPGDLVEHVLDPRALDPAARRWLSPGYAYARRGPLERRLVVYLVGANSVPKRGGGMLVHIASLGLPVIAVAYANDYDIANRCSPARDPDPDCHGKARLEAFEGQDHSTVIEVGRADSVEGRVGKALAHLAAREPGRGWDAFLEGGGPRWRAIVVTGHSHGASSAGLVSKVREVARVVMLSGPYDNRAGEPAPWTRLPPRTPTERVFAFSHAQEKQHAGHLADWAAMGLGAHGSVASVDGASPPYGGSHQLVTSVPPANGKDGHGATQAGAASPRSPDGRWALEAAWRHLYGVP
jgi:hypothetical protein